MSVIAKTESNEQRNPFIYQINVSNGGVPKHSIAQADIVFEGLVGDRQNNRALHGGKDRAVCLFSIELIELLRQEGHSIEAGSTGENLTIAGLDWPHIKPGDQLKIGETLHIEMTSYTVPCRHIARWFRGKNYTRISHKKHPGWSRLYAKVIVEGHVRRGDTVSIVEEETKMSEYS